ncbi:cytochrome c biogenesis protein ResB [Streptomyces macrosporus]|uniref:Cytochrome c biogenesis protein ResB n=1 Tax=Streptomyces macrosporus TaxID=44032 RepID=A0ABP5WC83_9ACTN
MPTADAENAPENAVENAEHRDAGARLSTAPREEATLDVPSLGPIGWARWAWRQLTSMRVALILLFLLSLAAVPGSLIPQKDVDPSVVEDFKRRHETLGPIYDKLQLFDVYSSVWFSAIYILLFISLIGCIVPRTWQFVGQLRGRPPRAPRRLTRMPAYTTWRTDAEPEKVLAAARSALRGRRFRTAGPDASPAGGSVSAEKGYLREVGNLVFHVSLIVMLLAFAAGTQWKSEGGKLIVEGDGFANTLTQYDDFTSGALYDAGDMDAFGFTLKDFEASFERSGPQRGTAREFRADVTYWEGADGEEKKTAIEVNHPLEVGDTQVYLIGHGYAPVVSVTDGQGELAYRGPVPFLPQDGNITSTGVIKVTDYRDKDGEREQLGFQGIFTPTYGIDEVRGPHSTFPELDYPVLSLNAFHGDLGVDSGLPQNVYQLDTDNMEQFKDDDGDLFRADLRPGESVELPNGAGTLKFESVKEWASFQVSQEPGEGWALGGAIAAVLGLAGSLFVQRRRVWVRAERGEDGTTLVEMAALGRSESARIPEELGDLALALQSDAPPAAERAEAEDTERERTAAGKTAAAPGATEGAGPSSRGETE